ncbi:MAG: choline ABC transporter permease subunit, partial [Mesorhizobium sp.]
MDPVSNLVASNKIPVGPWGKAFFDFLEVYFGTVLRAVSSGLDATLDWIVDALLWLPPVALAALIALLAWYLQRSKALALGVLIGLFFTINQGLWKQTVATLVLVVAAAAASMAIGLPIGIWTAHKPKAYRIIQPILDFMQTMPTFVYLIPILA